MRHERFIVPVLFAFALCAWDLPAAGKDKGKGKGKGTEQAVAQQPQMTFRALDRNRDGVITRNEWNGGRRSFDRIDANSDGRLSRDEVASEDARSGSGVQRRTIAAGTSISVRTNEPIDARSSDGRVFSSVVNQDVMDANGNIAIPKGSNAELIVRNGSGQDLALDLESVTVNGQRYAVTAGAQGASDGRKDGIGTNKRTAGYIGGGALLGTIIGAVAGGGKGAAIGAAAGAAAGAGAQVMTRGRAVNVPVESLLTFRLEQPLQMASDGGFERGGRHYHR